MRLKNIYDTTYEISAASFLTYRIFNALYQNKKRWPPKNPHRFIAWFNITLNFTQVIAYPQVFTYFHAQTDWKFQTFQSKKCIQILTISKSTLNTLLDGTHWNWILSFFPCSKWSLAHKAQNSSTWRFLSSSFSFCDHKYKLRT